MKINKYKNRKTNVGGIAFDSKKEANRWTALLLLEKSGEITNLRRQVRYELVPPRRENGKTKDRGVYYFADFVYTDNEGKEIVEDVKGYRTEVYKIKKKLMWDRYEIDIKEV